MCHRMRRIPRSGRPPAGLPIRRRVDRVAGSAAGEQEQTRNEPDEEEDRVTRGLFFVGTESKELTKVAGFVGVDSKGFIRLDRLRCAGKGLFHNP